MKKILLLSVCTIYSLLAFSQGDTSIAIIPQPVKLVRHAGSFILPSTIYLQVTDTGLMQSINALVWHLTYPTGSYMHVRLNKGVQVTIMLTINKVADTALGSEGYHLTVELD
jgi:hexosaminidase